MRKYRYEKGMKEVVFLIFLKGTGKKANNKYLTSYDPKKTTKYITYLD